VGAFWFDTCEKPVLSSNRIQQIVKPQVSAESGGGEMKIEKADVLTY
jgi:hypothetical protein